MPSAPRTTASPSIGRDSLATFAVQRLDLDVAEVHNGAVVLQSDVALTLEVLEGGVELVLGAVGIFARLGPVVEVGVDDWLVVHYDSDLRPPGGDDEVVPAVLFRRLLGRREGVVEGPAAVLIREKPHWPLDLNLQAGLDVVGRLVSADEDATIARRLKLEVEEEVAEAVTRPEVTGRLLAGEVPVLDDPAPPRLLARGGSPAGQVGPIEEAPAALLPLRRSGGEEDGGEGTGEDEHPETGHG